MTDLEKRIIEANTAYLKGEPIMTDQEWDSLMLELRTNHKDSELLSKGSLAVKEMSGSRKQKLPMPMFSLEKVTSLEELNDWADQFPVGTKFCISLKYDGISLLVGNTQVWTRGNGEEGQKSMDRFIYINDKSNKYCDKYMWGEGIMPKRNFEKYLESGEYKTARNLVAGQFNADNFSIDILKDIDFVCYGTDSYTSKVEFFLYQKLPHLTIKKENEDFTFSSTDLFWFNRFFEGGLKEYVVDGIVIEVDSKELCDKLGRLPNGNPKFAVALKLPEWYEKQKTLVKELELNVSKDGKIKPVAIIDPVELGGVTINRATCYNMAFVFDNNIVEGSTVELVRSGDVIPKILRTIEFNKGRVESLADDLVECPECGHPTKWDKNMVEVLCTNPKCSGKKMREMVYFLETMEFEEFGEPTIKRLYNSGINSIPKLLNATLQEFISIDGIGESKFNDLQKQKEILFSKKIPVARFITALNCFKGVIAEKSAQLIIDSVGFGETDIEKLLKIKGVGKETANSYKNGCEIYTELISDEYKDIHVKMNLVYEVPKVEQTGKSVCFSKVRDKELEAELSKIGHKIASGVSKNLTLLVVADVNGSSSKIKKANSLNIPVVSINDRDKIFEILNE